MPEPQDHDALYHRLGLEPGASQAEVVQAYRRLVHGVHPDAHPGDPGAPARFRLLREAYEALADPRRRADYDRWRLRHAAEQREARLAASTPVSVLGVQVAPVDPHTRIAPLRVGPVHVTPLPERPGGREAAWGSAAPPRATALIVLAAWLGMGR
jgi:DnaJ domain